ncbi:MAG: translation initiation factor IF-2 [Pirellulaceae bacterium]|nr:translation initiation factor IF-2 [Pirellulaceae bacterium]
MPKRIYALAKELAMDSKDLVDLCTKIGIQNKGSALASLEDDEVERIAKYIKGGDTPRAAAGPSASVAAPVPPAAAGPLPARRSGPIPNLNRRTAPSKQAPAPLAEPPPAAAAEEEAPTKIAAEATPQDQEQPRQPPAPVTLEPPTAQPPKRLSRDDYTPIAVGSGRVRVLDARRGSSDVKKPEGGDERRSKAPAQRREPIINLARLPKGAPAAVPPPKSSEPAPQRPEIRFTKDDISGQKQGMKAPLQELEAQQNAEKTEARGGRGSRSGSPGTAPGTAAPGGLKNFKAAADKAKGRYRSDEEEEAARGKKPGAGIAAARAERRKRGRSSLEGGEEYSSPRRGSRRLVRKGTNTAAPRKESAVLELPCNVRSFSEAAGVAAGRVLGTLMQMGHALTINANIDPELAELLATELDLELEFKHPQSLEEGLIDTIDQHVDTDEQLISRPPVVTFLGHVDHGKTSLLDYLIGTSVVTGEAGGITQHIRAYQVEKDGRIISFVDTPGHEAFTEMRARGANVTDIAVLVIAADDGIMPQTEEAISHAKAAEVPIVVALNKIDLQGVDENRILTQMTEHGLTPSEWGGDVEVVRTSATTGQGMDELLETLLTVAELHDYKANPNRAADGVCLEAEQQSDKGVVAKFIVQNGTLKPGDIVLCGSSHGRIKAMYDTLNPSLQIKAAGPTMPVNVTGLDLAPGAGDRFYVLDNIGQARELAETRSDKSRAQSLSGTSPKVSFETFQDLLQSGKLGKVEDMVELNLIIRADARGSLEAIEKELSKIDHPEVDIRILQKSVGGVTVADVTLASASQAVVVGFNVIPDENARALADERNVEIRRYDIIYKLAEDIKAIVEGRLRPEERIIELGRALVKTVFTISRVGAVAGCYVAQGTIERGCRIRVHRDGRTIGDYALDSLKRHKDDVKEVPRGMECGIRLAGFNDLKQDDVLEAYRVEEVARKLE